MCTDEITLDLSRYRHLDPFADDRGAWTFDIAGVLCVFEGEYSEAVFAAKRRAARSCADTVFLVHYRK